MLEAEGTDAIYGYLFEAEEALEAEGDAVVYFEFARHDEDVAHFGVVNGARFRAQFGGTGLVGKPNIQFGKGACSSFAKSYVHNDVRRVFTLHVVEQFGVVGYLHDSSRMVAEVRGYWLTVTKILTVRGKNRQNSQ